MNDIKTIITKHGGSMGSVMWMFDRVGIIRLAKSESEIDELTLIDAGAEDVQSDDDGVTVLTKPEDLASVTNKLNESGYSVESSELGYWPKIPMTFPEGSTGEKLETLLGLLDDNDDVSGVYTNAID